MDENEIEFTDIVVDDYKAVELSGTDVIAALCDNRIVSIRGSALDLMDPVVLVEKWKVLRMHLDEFGRYLLVVTEAKQTWSFDLRQQYSSGIRVKYCDSDSSGVSDFFKSRPTVIPDCAAWGEAELLVTGCGVAVYTGTISVVNTTLTKLVVPGANPVNAVAVHSANDRCMILCSSGHVLYYYLCRTNSATTVLPHLSSVNASLSVVQCGILEVPSGLGASGRGALSLFPFDHNPLVACFTWYSCGTIIQGFIDDNLNLQSTFELHLSKLFRSEVVAIAPGHHLLAVATSSAIFFLAQPLGASWKSPDAVSQLDIRNRLVGSFNTNAPTLDIAYNRVHRVFIVRNETQLFEVSNRSRSIQSKAFDLCLQMMLTAENFLSTMFFCECTQIAQNHPEYRRRLTETMVKKSLASQRFDSASREMATDGTLPMGFAVAILASIGNSYEYLQEYVSTAFRSSRSPLDRTKLAAPNFALTAAQRDKEDPQKVMLKAFLEEDWIDETLRRDITKKALQSSLQIDQKVALDLGFVSVAIDLSIARSQFSEAAHCLITFASSSASYSPLWEKYSWILLRRVPVLLIRKGWIPFGECLGFSPDFAVEVLSYYRTDFNESGTDHVAMEYMNHVLFRKLDNGEESFHNLFVRFAAEAASSHELVKHLTASPARYSARIALWHCLRHKRYDACAELYFILGHPEAAVDFALRHVSVDLAISFARKSIEAENVSPVLLRAHKERQWRHIMRHLEQSKVRGDPIILPEGISADVDIQDLIHKMSGKTQISSLEAPLKAAVETRLSDTKQCRDALARETQSKNVLLSLISEHSLEPVPLRTTVKCCMCLKHIFRSANSDNFLVFRGCGHAFHEECYAAGLETSVTQTRKLCTFCSAALKEADGVRSVFSTFLQLPFDLDLDLASVHRDADKKTIEEEAYENQRYFPILGWSSELLPTDRSRWSSRDGKARRYIDNDTIHPPSGFTWCTVWKKEVNEMTDSDGWMYAMDFPRRYYKKMRSMHYVRRRRWFRLAAPSEQKGLIELETYQHQQLLALQGWTKPLFGPEFATRDGRAARERGSVMPPSDYIWSSEWQVDHTPIGRQADTDGWWYNGARIGRKRRWVRKAMLRSQRVRARGDTEVKLVDSVAHSLHEWDLMEEDEPSAPQLDNSSFTPAGQSIITIDAYENQRFSILFGWTRPNQRYEWSSQDGKLQRRIDNESITPPSGFEWCSPWKPCVDPKHTDFNGWLYAERFDLDFHPVQHKCDSVRTRRWIRLSMRADELQKRELTKSIKEGTWDTAFRIAETVLNQQLELHVLESFRRIGASAKLRELASPILAHLLDPGMTSDVRKSIRRWTLLACVTGEEEWLWTESPLFKCGLEEVIDAAVYFIEEALNQNCVFKIPEVVARRFIELFGDPAKLKCFEDHFDPSSEPMLRIEKALMHARGSFQMLLGIADELHLLRLWSTLFSLRMKFWDMTVQQLAKPDAALVFEYLERGLRGESMIDGVPLSSDDGAAFLSSIVKFFAKQAGSQHKETLSALLSHQPRQFLSILQRIVLHCSPEIGDSLLKFVGEILSGLKAVSPHALGDFHSLMLKRILMENWLPLKQDQDVHSGEGHRSRLPLKIIKGILELPKSLAESSTLSQRENLPGARLSRFIKGIADLPKTLSATTTAAPRPHREAEALAVVGRAMQFFAQSFSDLEELNRLTIQRLLLDLITSYPDVVQPAASSWACCARDGKMGRTLAVLQVCQKNYQEAMEACADGEYMKLDRHLSIVAPLVALRIERQAGSASTASIVQKAFQSVGSRFLETEPEAGIYLIVEYVPEDEQEPLLLRLVGENAMKSRAFYLFCREKKSFLKEPKNIAANNEYIALMHRYEPEALHSFLLEYSERIHFDLNKTSNLCAQTEGAKLAYIFLLGKTGRHREALNQIILLLDSPLSELRYDIVDAIAENRSPPHQSVRLEQVAQHGISTCTTLNDSASWFLLLDRFAVPQSTLTALRNSPDEPRPTNMTPDELNIRTRDGTQTPPSFLRPFEKAMTDAYSTYITLLLSKMYVQVGPVEIIQKICEDSSQYQLSSLRSVLENMLESLKVELEALLLIVRSAEADSFAREQQMYESLTSCLEVNSSSCTHCGEDVFSSRAGAHASILCFSCGHVFHASCCKDLEDGSGCPRCFGESPRRRSFSLIEEDAGVHVERKSVPVSAIERRYAETLRRLSRLSTGVDEVRCIPTLQACIDFIKRSSSPSPRDCVETLAFRFAAHPTVPPREPPTLRPSVRPVRTQLLQQEAHTVELGCASNEGRTFSTGEVFKNISMGPIDFPSGFEKKAIAAAPFGGPICLASKSKGNVLFEMLATSGEILSSATVEYRLGTPQAGFWTSSGQLVWLTETGHALHFPKPCDLNTFSDVPLAGIEDAAFSGTGSSQCAVGSVTIDGWVISVFAPDEFTQKLSTWKLPGLSSDPFLVVPLPRMLLDDNQAGREHSFSSAASQLWKRLATHVKDLQVCMYIAYDCVLCLLAEARGPGDKLEIRQELELDSPAVLVKPTPNYSNVAIVTQRANLFISRIALNVVLSRCNLIEIPTNLSWCTPNLLLATFALADPCYSLMLPLSATEGETIEWNESNSIVAIVEEPDGVRVVQAKSITFFWSPLRPHPLNDVESFLIDCYQKYCAGKPKAVAGLIERFEENPLDLDEGVSRLLIRAVQQHEQNDQHFYLSAATFCMSFSRTFESSEAINVCRILHGLVVIRRVGLYLTHDQLLFLNLGSRADDADWRTLLEIYREPQDFFKPVFHRLLFWRRFNLAFEIMTYFKGKVEPILTQWAVTAIEGLERTEESMVGVESNIHLLRKRYPSISVGDIVASALYHHHPTLAKKFVDEIPDIPLRSILQMLSGDPSTALQTIVEFDDSNGTFVLLFLFLKIYRPDDPSLALRNYFSRLPVLASRSISHVLPLLIGEAPLVALWTHRRLFTLEKLSAGDSGLSALDDVLQEYSTVLEDKKALHDSSEEKQMLVGECHLLERHKKLAELAPPTVTMATLSVSSQIEQLLLQGKADAAHSLSRQYGASGLLPHLVLRVAQTHFRNGNDKAAADLALLHKSQFKTAKDYQLARLQCLTSVELDIWRQARRAVGSPAEEAQTEDSKGVVSRLVAAVENAYIDEIDGDEYAKLLGVPLRAIHALVLFHCAELLIETNPRRLREVQQLLSIPLDVFQYALLQVYIGNMQWERLLTFVLQDRFAIHLGIVFDILEMEGQETAYLTVRNELGQSFRTKSYEVAFTTMDLRFINMKAEEMMKLLLVEHRSPQLAAEVGVSLMQKKPLSQFADTVQCDPAIKEEFCSSLKRHLCCVS